MKKSVPVSDRPFRKLQLSRDGYNSMLLAQGNRCAICGCPPKPNKRLALDHNHKTGKIRALLCDRCNTSMGMVGESIEVLCNMITYLIEHNELGVNTIKSEWFKRRRKTESSDMAQEIDEAVANLDRINGKNC